MLKYKLQVNVIGKIPVCKIAKKQSEGVCFC